MKEARGIYIEFMDMRNLYRQAGSSQFCSTRSDITFHFFPAIAIKDSTGAPNYSQQLTILAGTTTAW